MECKCNYHLGMGPNLKCPVHGEHSGSASARLPLLGADTATENNGNYTVTMETLMEAKALIEALAPKEAPPDVNMINGMSGLRIMKNDMLPENTVMVSKRLFDLIYESAPNGLA